MKNLLITIFLFFNLITLINAQGRMGMGRDMKPLQRLEEFEKFKLIEVLGINEETAIRFFARRNEHQKKMKDILDQRDKLMTNVEEAFKNTTQSSDNFYKDHVANLLSIEANITKERENFIKSLIDLLNPQQVAKLIVFESRFRREVRETLMGRGKGPMAN
jgi:hypothetical protein